MDREADAGSEFSVIVAIKDQLQVAQRCLASLQKYGEKAEVILVDDGSQEPTRDFLRQMAESLSWKLLRHDEALGHSRSCEDGAQLASRNYLCLLNSDTVVTPWSWRGVLDAFNGDPAIGIVGPATSHSATVQMDRRAMHCRHYWTDSQIFAYARNYVKKRAPYTIAPIDQAGGFAFFIRRDCWDSLGGFDRNLADYGNESELCIRARQAGWKVVWTRNSYIHHLGGQSYPGSIFGFNRDKSDQANAYIRDKHRIVSGS